MELFKVGSPAPENVIIIQMGAVAIKLSCHLISPLTSKYVFTLGYLMCSFLHFTITQFKGQYYYGTSLCPKKNLSDGTLQVRKGV
jgi:hypothetical protein